MNNQSSPVGLSKQAWIDCPLLDLIFIIFPAFGITAFVLAFPSFFAQANQLPLWLLAWTEEGIWDGLVWRQHLSFFAPFSHLPYNLSALILIWLVPLLALPQSTHYILDGFIWSLKHQTHLQ